MLRLKHIIPFLCLTVQAFLSYTSYKKVCMVLHYAGILQQRKPILKTGFALANSRNIHGQRQKTQRHLYSNDWRRGLASGKTEIRGFALAPRYQHVGIPNAKFWHRGYCPTPTPNTRNFASQWNIGLILYR